MSTGLGKTTPKIVLPVADSEYTLFHLPKNFEYIPSYGENGKISVKDSKGRERFWAEVVKEANQVAPGGNRGALCSVHLYVTRQLKVIGMERSPRGKNVVNEFYRKKEGPVLRIGDWTFTGMECYCIGCMLVTLICVSVTIGYLMTLPCPLL